jgi:hypothetical protein
VCLGGFGFFCFVGFEFEGLLVLGLKAWVSCLFVASGVYYLCT